MSLSASVKLSIAAILSGTLDLSTQKASLNQMFSQSWDDGAGANQANVIIADSRTLAASANEDLDLAGGGLTDLLGAAANFARIKAIIIKARAENTNNVQVTRPAANSAPLFMAASDGISLAPGEVFAWFSGTAAGKALTGGTADLLNIANSAGTTGVTYDIIIIGAAT
jgi:hypothetical protein